MMERSAKVSVSATVLSSPDGKLLPHGKELVSTSEALAVARDVGELEALLEVVDETLVLEEEGDVVKGGDVVDSKDLLGRDVTEHGDLLRDGLGEGSGAAAGDLLRKRRVSEFRSELEKGERNERGRE